MQKSVRILGKKAIPMWLLVLALVAAGAGAAAGTVLAGKVTGETNVAVSQALLVGYRSNNPATVVWYTVTEMATDVAGAVVPQQVTNHKGMVAIPARAFFAVKDDNTAFQAAAEVATGDWAAFSVPLKNASSNSLTAQLTLDVPEGLEVEVYAGAGASNITQVVRIGLNTWKFTLASTTSTDFGQASWLSVVISTDDAIAPGYYTIGGTIKQIGY